MAAVLAAVDAAAGHPLVVGHSAASTLAWIAADAIPVPEAVTTGTVRLINERRFDVPVTLICPEFSPSQATEWVDTGQVPELSRAHTVEYVNIDSGHWPMFTQPEGLAHLIAAIADA